MPLPEIVSRTKSVVTRLQEMTKEQLAADLYFVETFISDRRRSVLKNIQDNFEDTYEKAGSALESGDFIVCCLLIINKFYELYYYNNVQNDVNAVVAKAMKLPLPCHGKKLLRYYMKRWTISWKENWM